MGLGLSNSQRGPWALDCPTACKDSKRYCRIKDGAKYLEDMDPRREGTGQECTSEGKLEGVRERKLLRTNATTS